MEVNVVSLKLVKPCMPTPPHQQTYKITLLDETNPTINHVRLLYFSYDDRIEEKLVSLEHSLAQILSKFHPLAGRYNKQKREVDCNDEGALYSIAECECELSQIVGAADVELEQLNHLLPVDVAAADDPAHPMLAVQINRFRCGGFAIGLCASHRVVDSAAFALFLTAWAAAAASCGEHLIQPYFDDHSYFLGESLPVLDFHESKTQENIRARRFVFNSEAIQKLRERLSKEWKSMGAERQPFRVAAVSAFLTQADRVRHGKPRAAVIGQIKDIRGRTLRRCLNIPLARGSQVHPGTHCNRNSGAKLPRHGQKNMENYGAGYP